MTPMPAAPEDDHDHDHHDDGEAEDAIFVAAARHLTRRNDPTWTAADERGFQAWLQAAPAHRSAWDEVAATDALADALVARRTRDRRRRRSGITALLLLAGLLAGGWWWWQRGADPAASAAAPVVYHSVVGSTRSVVLPDGSRAELDADSRLRWLPRAAGDQRWLVVDRGRVFLDVAPDPQRPLVLRAGVAELRVLGTAFEVDLRGVRTAVGVAEGTVRVDRLAAGGRAAEAVRLEAGQHALVAERIRARLIDPADVGAWRSGRLVFHERPLADVLRELRRYHAVELSASPAAARLSLSGVLQHGPLAEQLATLAAILDLRIEGDQAGGRHLRLANER